MNRTNGEKCEKYDCLESFQVINDIKIALRGCNMLYCQSQLTENNDTFIFSKLYYSGPIKLLLDA